MNSFDFNRMLDMPLGATDPPHSHLRKLLHREPVGAPTSVADHCHACTSGQNSSCGGALNGHN